MLNMILSKIRRYRKERYLSLLVKRGLKLGKNIQIEGDVSFDSSHCFLISIGDNCFFADGATILAHNAGPYRFIGVTQISKVTILNNCGIGMRAIIFPGVTIGPNTIIGAGSIVTRDIPSNCLAAGSPAKVICSLDDYLAQHKLNSEKYRVFNEEQYSMSVLTEKRKEEMLAYLGEHPMAYMAGTTSDISVFGSGK